MKANSLYSRALARSLQWLESMRQHDGYGGPVVHYWNDSLHYIGPRRDWRIEGLMATFISLHQKTNDSKWLRQAQWLGETTLENQLPDGRYFISDFEETPSFFHSAQPHEAAVNNGLLMLAEALVEKKSAEMEAQSFLAGAEKNISDVLLPLFWNPREESFQQYQRGQFDQAPNLFVPNKIATICESLVRLYALTGKKNYLEHAEKAAEKILEHQAEEKELRGGIHQSNAHDKLITFYTARCVRPLQLLAKSTKRARYSVAARKAITFIANMQHANGAFEFGFDAQNKRLRFPYFAAGTAEMLSALQSQAGNEKAFARGMKWMLAKQHPNGGFDSFEGIAEKNNAHAITPTSSWKNHLPVVGWMDKTMRLLAGMPMKSLPSVEVEKEYRIACADGELIENGHEIKVKGEQVFHFGKKELFSQSHFSPLKQTLLAIGKHHTPLRSLASAGFRATVRL